MTTASEKRSIGTAAVQLSRLGAGTASLGDVFGAVDESAAASLLQACLDNGVSYVDTAPLYGNGLSETRLGAALRELGQPQLTISTKVGRTLDATAPEGRYFDFSRDAILRGFESSLLRLGRDRVDVLYLHDPDDYEDDVYRAAWPALESLRSEGVVGAIGVGMNQWQMPLRFVERLDIDVVMIAGRFTLLDSSAADELLPACEQRSVAVVAAGVFNSGILVNPVDGAWYDYQPASEDSLLRARTIEQIAAAFGVTLAELALHYPYGHPAVTSVVVGVGSARTLNRNLDALAKTVPIELFEQLRAEGLL